MKKIFISQPMYGLSDEQITKERNKAFEEVKAKYDSEGEEITLIDSFLKDMQKDSSPMVMLGEAIKLMSDADAVYMAKGWSGHRGCTMEYLCAKEYGIPVIDHDDCKYEADDRYDPDFDYGLSSSDDRI